MLFSNLLLSAVTCAALPLAQYSNVENAQALVVERVAELGYLYSKLDSHTFFSKEAAAEAGAAAKKQYYDHDNKEATGQHMRRLIQENFGYEFGSSTYIDFVVKGGLKLYVDAKADSTVTSSPILDFLRNEMLKSLSCGIGGLDDESCDQMHIQAMSDAAREFKIDVGDVSYPLTDERDALHTDNNGLNK